MRWKMEGGWNQVVAVGVGRVRLGMTLETELSGFPGTG